MVDTYVSALHKHVLSHTQRDGSCRGLWHSSHRQRLHCGHVIELSVSPLAGWISTSSCKPAVDESFENGNGCFVIAVIGNTLLRSHLFGFARIAAGMSVQRMALSPCLSRRSCWKKAKSMIEFRARPKFEQSATAAFEVRPTNGCVFTSAECPVVTDVCDGCLSPLMMAVRSPLRLLWVDWWWVATIVGSLFVVANSNNDGNESNALAWHSMAICSVANLLRLMLCAAVVYLWVVCTPAWWSRDTSFGVRNGVSTYSFASRSVSGLGAASVTGDICVSKCWLLFDWFDSVDDVRDDIMGNAEPGGGGLRLEKLVDVSGTVIGSVVAWNLNWNETRIAQISTIEFKKSAQMFATKRIKRFIMCYIRYIPAITRLCLIQLIMLLCRRRRMCMLPWEYCECCSNLLRHCEMPNKWKYSINRWCKGCHNIFEMSTARFRNVQTNWRMADAYEEALCRLLTHFVWMWIKTQIETYWITWWQWRRYLMSLSRL